jgi:NAD(P)-dependent dehydrogenase (short-subunit alcohol dehydrogenase family)
MGRLDGKVAYITGAGSGIGKATSGAFVDEGARVVVAELSADLGQATVDETGTIEAFTILEAEFPGLPDPPLVIAFVTLDGADTAILNFVHGLDLSDIDAAAEYLFEYDRVRVRFADERGGRITDFHFEHDAADEGPT